jgi:hypothetical protein
MISTARLSDFLHLSHKGDPVKRPDKYAPKSEIHFFSSSSSTKPASGSEDKGKIRQPPTPPKSYKFVESAPK